MKNEILKDRMQQLFEVLQKRAVGNDTLLNIREHKKNNYVFPFKGTHGTPGAVQNTSCKIFTCENKLFTFDNHNVNAEFLKLIGYNGVSDESNSKSLFFGDKKRQLERILAAEPALIWQALDYIYICRKDYSTINRIEFSKRICKLIEIASSANINVLPGVLTHRLVKNANIGDIWVLTRRLAGKLPQHWDFISECMLTISYDDTSIQEFNNRLQAIQLSLVNELPVKDLLSSLPHWYDFVNYTSAQFETHNRKRKILIGTQWDAVQQDTNLTFFLNLLNGVFWVYDHDRYVLFCQCVNHKNATFNSPLSLDGVTIHQVQHVLSVNDADIHLDYHNQQHWAKTNNITQYKHGSFMYYLHQHQLCNMQFNFDNVDKIAMKNIEVRG